MTLIRPARQDDAPALSAILRELGWFSALKSETAPETQRRLLRHLELTQADDSHAVFIAETEPGQVAGYLSIHWIPYLFLAGPEGLISELFVGASFRGQGVGSALLDTAESEARRRGCARLMLINNRGRESYRREFYIKHGWVEREDMANFVKMLSP